MPPREPASSFGAPASVRAPKRGNDHVVTLRAGAENSKGALGTMDLSGSFAQTALAVDCSPVADPETDSPVKDTSTVSDVVALLMATTTVLARARSAKAEI
jgi:hypothetical protein